MHRSDRKRPFSGDLAYDLDGRYSKHSRSGCDDDRHRCPHRYIEDHDCNSKRSRKSNYDDYYHHGDDDRFRSCSPNRSHLLYDDCYEPYYESSHYRDRTAHLSSSNDHRGHSRYRDRTAHPSSSNDHRGRSRYSSQYSRCRKRQRQQRDEVKRRQRHHRQPATQAARRRGAGRLCSLDASRCVGRESVKN
ncbi:hypothetical protein ACOMHN_059143 [Nucella lapillus]